jgi:hypothetical protein
MSNTNIFTFSNSYSRIHPVHNLSYPKINSFDSVNITKPNSLVICDIDNTLLYWNKKPEELYYLVEELYPGCNLEDKNTHAEQFLNMYKRIHPPSHTDSEGFDRFIKRINNMSSELVFLTARQKLTENYTKKNLSAIGIDYDKYPVYYTDNLVTKGEYIKNYIQTEKYSQIIFIDDYDSYILSVLNLFPDVICYKFEITQI